MIDPGQLHEDGSDFKGEGDFFGDLGCWGIIFERLSLTKNLRGMSKAKTCVKN